MILVDGSSLLHRVLSTDQAELKDSSGRYTGGLHGFLISLGSVATKYRLKHQIIVAWDLGIPLFRREIYREYKPHKFPIGDVANELKSAQNLLEREGEEAPNEWLEKYVMSRHLLHKKFLPMTGCLSIHVQNCEADDIIAYVCEKVLDEEIIILSTDRDLIQLLNKDRSFYDGRTQTTIMIDDIIKEHKLEGDWRQHWMLARAMAGDGSDGIPGVGPGFSHCIEYARQVLRSGEPLGQALIKLEKVPRGRSAGFEAMRTAEETIKRNLKLIDLRYPIMFNLPIVKDIQTQIASCQFKNIDPDLVELELHDLQMVKAKPYANSIIESNLNFESIDYIKRMT